MNRLAIILTVVILPTWALPVSADGFFGLFGKKTKVNPAERVPVLVATLKTDQDERKRASAAAELASFDAAAFPEIVPSLVDALQNDSKSSVRMDAASSLGTLRPVSQLAGQALERTVSGDESFRVRLHAKGILIKYRLAGYAPGPKVNPPVATGPKTNEPPLLDQSTLLKLQGLPPGTPAPAQFPTGPGTFANTSMTQVPHIANKDDEGLEFRPTTPRPEDQGSTFSTSVPQRPSQPPPAPLPMVDSDGPALTPLPPSPPQ